MIIFNTIRKAEHYVKWCNKSYDYHHDGYDWCSRSTYIIGDMVLVREAGDGCGCGCDMYIYDSISVIGRIKDKRSKTLNQVLE